MTLSNIREGERWNDFFFKVYQFEDDGHGERGDGGVAGDLRNGGNDEADHQVHDPGVGVLEEGQLAAHIGGQPRLLQNKHRWVSEAL